MVGAFMNQSLEHFFDLVEQQIPMELGMAVCARGAQSNSWRDVGLIGIIKMIIGNNPYPCKIGTMTINQNCQVSVTIINHDQS